MTKIVDNLNHNRDKLYEFDAIGRILKAKGGVAAGGTGRLRANWTQTYSYDRYGNKTGVTATGITQDGNAVPADGLTSVTASISTNRITTSGWEYDLTGNLIRGQNVSGVWQKFEYDAAGRLKKVKDDSNNVLETYTYGATREKLMVETSTQRTYYAWGGQSIVAEYTETGSDTSPDYSKSYIYAGSRLLMTATMVNATTETKELHHPNRLGTELVTDGGAGTSYRQTTLPFGTALAAESTGNSNQVFTSYDRSATTGLDYAVNRTYSQGQSRFTQVDPIGMSAASAGNPQSNNLYAYTQNMPTDFVDPSGLLMAWLGGSLYDCQAGCVDRGDGTSDCLWTCTCVGFCGGGSSITVGGGLGGPDTGGHGPGGPPLQPIGISTNACSTVMSLLQYDNVIGGKWRGLNNKLYPKTWGGNQWTGPRRAPMAAAKSAKIAGRFLFGLGIAISAEQMRTGEVSPEKGAVDMTMNAAGTFLGLGGFAANTIYTGVDLIVSVPDPGGKSRSKCAEVLTNKLGTSRR